MHFWHLVIQVWAFAALQSGTQDLKGEQESQEEQLLPSAARPFPLGSVQREHRNTQALAAEEEQSGLMHSLYLSQLEQVEQLLPSAARAEGEVTPLQTEHFATHTLAPKALQSTGAGVGGFAVAAKPTQGTKAKQLLQVSQLCPSEARAPGLAIMQREHRFRQATEANELQSGLAQELKREQSLQVSQERPSEASAPSPAPMQTLQRLAQERAVNELQLTTASASLALAMASKEH
mmetsp:Transcript_13775/g.26707  ORF Transcript_13775/g.26707 Transcript_13775/m.26707 type:complete len:235 (-) Transcript_13775:3398-4102(-)